MRFAERMNASVSGSGPRTVILANGFCTSSRSWDAIMPHLSGSVRIVRFE